MSDRVDFNPLAGDYARFRTGYGPDVFGAIGRRIGPGRSAPALDLACGTGLSTDLLARLAGGLTVGADVALELMRRAPRTAGSQQMHYVGADAIQLPFVDASFVLITCAQALHWLSPAEVMPEVLRLLAPGGWFFAYWKYPAPEEPYQLLANDVLSRLLGRTIESRYTLRVNPDLPSHGFAETATEEFRFALPYTASEYVGFMRSRRRIHDIAGDRTEEFLAEYAALLAERWPDETPFTEENVVSLFSGRKPF